MKHVELKFMLIWQNDSDNLNKYLGNSLFFLDPAESDCVSENAQQRRQLNQGW